MKENFPRFLVLSVFLHLLLFLLFLRILIPIDGRRLLCVPNQTEEESGFGLAQWPTEKSQSIAGDGILTSDIDGSNGLTQPVGDGMPARDSQQVDLIMQAAAQSSGAQSGLGEVLAELVAAQIVNHQGRIDQALSVEETQKLIDRMLQNLQEQLGGDRGPLEDAWELSRQSSEGPAMAKDAAGKLKEAVLAELYKKLQEALAAAGPVGEQGGDMAFSAKAGGNTGSGNGSGNEGQSSSGADGKGKTAEEGSNAGELAGGGQSPDGGRKGSSDSQVRGDAVGMAGLLAGLTAQDLADLQVFAALLNAADYQMLSESIAPEINAQSGNSGSVDAAADQIAAALEKAMGAGKTASGSTLPDLPANDISQLAEDLVKNISSQKRGGAAGKQMAGSSGSYSPRRGGVSATNSGFRYDLLKYLENTQKLEKASQNAVDRRYRAPLANWGERPMAQPDAVYLPSNRPKVSTPQPAKLQEPRYQNNAWGAAVRVTTPVVVDGNLSDWKDAELYHLSGEMQGNDGQLPPFLEASNSFMVKWDAVGLYFAYYMRDIRDRQATVDDFWNGDALEIFIDPENAKSSDRLDGRSLQYWFWPRHSGHRGAFGKMRFEGDGRRRTVTLNRAMIAIASIRDGQGYICEVFLPKQFFKDLSLTPGNIIGFNYSMNNGEDAYLRWVTNKGDNIAFRPNLWGDLLLMGSDAQIKPLNPYWLPGQTYAVEVFDPDKNVNPSIAEQITVILVNKSTGFRSILNFVETTSNSGVFKGRIAGDLPGSGDSGVFPISPGDNVRIQYLDEFTSGGRNSLTRQVQVPVARATMRFAKYEGG